MDGRVLIKKEIPSPETIDEFLYEVNALHSLRFSDHVVRFHGVVVDDEDERIKGLLISYADQGALVDVIYDHCKDAGRGIAWSIRERWARQIVQGLSDIHEAGFVQGDFTLSNIVIDAAGDAKIIDINRRGCPVGWEPPEAAPLIETNQRISMYIGVKSDLFQLGMVLWGLAMEEDEPELQGRPLILGPEVGVPDWYRQITEICLSYDPRMRLQASSLLHMFPSDIKEGTKDDSHLGHASISVDDGYSLRNYLVDELHPDGHPHIKTVEPPSEWPYLNRRYASPSPYQPYYHTRGRSPPSPLPSNIDRNESPRGRYGRTTWAANINIAPSYSDVGADELPPYGVSRQPTPTPTIDKIPLRFSDVPEAPQPVATQELETSLEPPAADQWDLETPRGEGTPDDTKTKEPKHDDKDALYQVVMAELAANLQTQANNGTQDNDTLAAQNLDAETSTVPPAMKETETVGTDQAEPAADHGISVATNAAKDDVVHVPETTDPEGNTALNKTDIGEAATEKTTDPASSTPEEKSATTVGVDLEPSPSCTNDTSVPRTVHVPDSLTGIGTGHGVDEAETMREKGTIHDDEFTVEAKLDEAPALIATTGANA